jgi:hypothetical protein
VHALSALHGQTQERGGDGLRSARHQKSSPGQRIRCKIFNATKVKPSDTRHRNEKKNPVRKPGRGGSALTRSKPSTGAETESDSRNWRLRVWAARAASNGPKTKALHFASRRFGHGEGRHLALENERPTGNTAPKTSCTCRGQSQAANLPGQEKNGEERLGLKCSELRQCQEKKNRPTGNKSTRTDLARINFSIATQQVLQPDYRGRRPLPLLI